MRRQLQIPVPLATKQSINLRFEVKYFNYII